MDHYRDWTYDNKLFEGLPEIVEDLHHYGQKHIMIIVSWAFLGSALALSNKGMDGWGGVWYYCSAYPPPLHACTDSICSLFSGSSYQQWVSGSVSTIWWRCHWWYIHQERHGTDSHWSCEFGTSIQRVMPPNYSDWWCWSLLEGETRIYME